MSLKKSVPLTEKVLHALAEKTGEFISSGIELVFEPRKLAREYGIAFGYNQQSFPKMLRTLQRSPYFEYKDKKFYVTEKGRMKIIRDIIRNKKRSRKIFNGQWNGIIFDIPEANRRERAFIRSELNAAGCKELQKSVWVTPYDIEKELRALLVLWKKDFKGDIRFLKINQI
ncbi:MAG: hypothetical protein NTV36_01070, partial [Candidatus Staskawiczbacteria bacterium]|nr:hypothetical protein [Candidatus Staskawiczbacteria bacterium]